MGDGNDTAKALGGEVNVYGGDGADTITGGPGTDAIHQDDCPPSSPGPLARAPRG